MLWLERSLPAAWPALGVVGGFACAGLLGVIDRLAVPTHAVLLVGGAAALAWAVRQGRRGWTRPTGPEADRRLERTSGLAHRPLAVLADHPATADVTGMAMWARHRAQAVAKIGRLRVGPPDAVMPGRDPRAMRLLLLLGLAIGLLVAGPDTEGRLWRAFVPQFPAAPLPPPLEVRAWVAPPAFTGLPPSMLPAGQATIPAGARLTVSVTGGGGTPSLQLLDAKQTTSAAPTLLDTVGDGSFQAQLTPGADGRLLVQRDGATLAAWDLTLRPDLAPVVVWTHPPWVQRGSVPAVRLPWHASHAYGVASLGARFALRDRPDLPPLAVALPLPGERLHEADGVAATDLTADPRAGLPVVASLVARDGAGLTGISEAVPFVLPQRRFRHPVARAIVGIRQRLVLEAAPLPAARALRALGGQADLWQGEPPPPELADIAAVLDPAPQTNPAQAQAETIAKAQPRLWALALQLEETTPARTATALRQAQKDLHAALDRSPSHLADKTEVDRRAQALQDALRRHLDALAQQARRDPGSVTPIPPEQRGELDRTLQQLRDASRQDRTDDARSELSELDQALDRMREASRGPEQKKRAQGRKRGLEQMTALQDLVRREAGMIDGAERRLADPSIEAPGSEVAQTLDATRAKDAAVQGALRRTLGELMQQHGDLTGTVPKYLGEADQAMRDAARALRGGRDDDASAAALRAVEALQQGGEQMGQALARKFGRPQPSQQSGQDGQDAQGHDEGQDSPGQDGGGQEGQGAEGQGRGDGGEAQYGQGGGPEDDDPNGQGGGEEATAPGESGGPEGRSAVPQLDPLGRSRHQGGTGTDGGLDTRVPEEMERARGRAVQDELRRRDAQRTRPQPELDYFGRLLGAGSSP